MSLSPREAVAPVRVVNSPTAILLGHVTAGVIAVAAAVILSLFFDGRIAMEARMLPPDAVAWGRLLSVIGLSGWMFAVSAFLAVAPLIARRTEAGRHLARPLTLLAERAAYVFATLAVQGIAAQLIKHLVGRARPKLLPGLGPYSFNVLSMKSALASFPSGHTATAFAMALALGLLAPRLRVALFALAVAIASSRIVVQAHYLSDLVAGCALGTGSAVFVARLCADRGIAFVRGADGLRVKGVGEIAAAFGCADERP